MLIPLAPGVPLHRRIYDHIRGSVLDGRLRPGARLPSSRALAQDLGVSRTVVVQAYERLASEGIVESRVGSGTYVRQDLPSAPRRPAGPPRVRGAPIRLSSWARRASPGERRREMSPTPEPEEPSPAIDFAYGLPDSAAFPRALWRRCLARASRSVPTGYAHAGGCWALRRSVSGYLARSRGVVADPEQVIVTSGSQQALDLAARLLVDPGDVVILEEPHYQGARRAFQASGARLLPVPVDRDGLDPDALPAGSNAQVLCVTPSHQFPTGGVLTLPRRLRLLEWARERGTVIFEDDYDGEYRYDVPPVEAIYALDDAGSVLYSGTFSKVLFPGLRLGYLVLPPDLVTATLAAKWLTDRHSSVLEQEALAAFIDDGHFERHIRRTRSLYGKRRQALLDALESELGSRAVVVGADAGLHVLVWLPELTAVRAPELKARARERGVGVYGVSPYYLRSPEPAGLVFGYSTVRSEDITRGVRALRETLDRM